MIGSKKWLTLTSVALSGAICAAPLLAQNQGRNSGGNANAGGNKPGVFRSFFQNAFGRGNSEPNPENEPEAPPVNSTKPKTMPKANNFKQTTKSNNTPPIEPNDDGGPRTFFNRPQPTTSTGTLSSIARNVCLCHPDARREIIAALNDRSEARRLAAVQALVSAAQHQCPQCGRSPCDDDVVAQILADIAYGKDASSRWLEPSENVRYTAREALRFGHREVDTGVVSPPPSQTVAPSQRRQTGSFVSDDDNIPSRDESYETSRETSNKPAPVTNQQLGVNPNRSTFSNRSPAQSRSLSDNPATVVSDDPVDPPRPTPSTSRSGVGFAVPGRGSNTTPTRITNSTISDDPPVNDSKTIESEPISAPFDASKRSSAPSRLMSPELDTTSPVDDGTSPPAPGGGTVIVGDSPPSLPDASANRRSSPVDEVSPELNSNDSNSGGKVSSRRGKRPAPAPVAAPALATPTPEAPRVETPAAPAHSPAPISTQPAPAIAPVTPAPVTSLTPGLGKPSVGPTPTEAAPTAAAPTLVTPAPVAASPTPALTPTPASDEPGPTPAPIKSSLPTTAPIRSVGPSGSTSTPSLAPAPLSESSDSDKAPTLAPTPAGGPQLGPAAKKPTPAGSPSVIRSSFDMSPARGSRISAYDEKASAPSSQGTSTITIK